MPTPPVRFDAMHLVPWPSLEQQLRFVAWATSVMPWAELVDFDAPGALVVILCEDAGIHRDGGGITDHQRACGYLDLVWRHEGTWQRLDGRVIELASEVVDRVRCDVAPTFDGSPGGAATICKRFGPRADRMMQLRLTEPQRAQLGRLQPLLDRCAEHLLDDVQRAFLRDHPMMRSDNADLEEPLRKYLLSTEQLAAEYLPLHRRETAKLWAAVHRLGGLLGYRLH
jgi:hypothetical protein